MPVTQQVYRDKLLYYRLLSCCGAEGDPRLPCLRRYYQVNANGGQGTLDLMTASHALGSIVLRIKINLKL